MLASTRRHRITRRAPRSLAVAAALTLGLAACGSDDGTDADTETDVEVEEPADDDGAVDDGAVDDGGEEQPEAAPSFEDLEEGEIVPGVYLDVPEDEAMPAQAQPTPVGSAYVAALPDQAGAVSVNVEFEGTDLDTQLAAIDALVESGQAEVTAEPEEVEVEGADDARRVELAAPGGGATATGLFMVADGNAVSIAIEVTEESDLDVETIIASLRIDPERLQMAGTAEAPDAPTDGAVDDGAADDGTTDAGTDDGATDEG